MLTETHSISTGTQFTPAHHRIALQNSDEPDGPIFPLGQSPNFYFIVNQRNNKVKNPFFIFIVLIF
jgi:hypothetical protein